MRIVWRVKKYRNYEPVQKSEALLDDRFLADPGRYLGRRLCHIGVVGSCASGGWSDHWQVLLGLFRLYPRD
jgi:hypothetical protein